MSDDPKKAIIFSCRGNEPERPDRPRMTLADFMGGEEALYEMLNAAERAEARNPRGREKMTEWKVMEPVGDDDPLPPQRAERVPAPPGANEIAAWRSVWAKAGSFEYDDKLQQTTITLPDATPGKIVFTRWRMTFEGAAQQDAAAIVSAVEHVQMFWNGSAITLPGRVPESFARAVGEEAKRQGVHILGCDANEPVAAPEKVAESSRPVPGGRKPPGSTGAPPAFN